MKKVALFLLMAVALTGFAQQPQSYYNETLGWEINLPDGFTQAGAGESQRGQAQGMAAFKNAYETDVALADAEHAGSPLMLYKNGAALFEARLQEAAGNADETREESFRFEAHLMEETFKRQAPDARIMQVASSENIGGIEFLKTTFLITLPGNKQFFSQSFSGIVNGKDLRVNLVYNNEADGEKMLDALRHSDFNSRKYKL